jgi:hypothetical protein
VTRPAVPAVGGPQGRRAPFPSRASRCGGVGLLRQERCCLPGSRTPGSRTEPRRTSSGTRVGSAPARSGARNRCCR